MLDDAGMGKTSRSYLRCHLVSTESISGTLGESKGRSDRRRGRTRVRREKHEVCLKLRALLDPRAARVDCGRSDMCRIGFLTPARVRPVHVCPVVIARLQLDSAPAPSALASHEVDTSDRHFVSTSRKRVIGQTPGRQDSFASAQRMAVGWSRWSTDDF